MSNSKRVKVEGGWLGPTCSVPSEVNQISCFLPFPTCGEEWAEPWIKYKARYMISCWKDPPPSDQQSVSQQCGDPQAGVMMLSLKRASPAQSERWPREDPPHLAWAAAAVKKQKKKWGFHVVNQADTVHSAIRDRKAHIHTQRKSFQAPV